MASHTGAVSSPDFSTPSPMVGLVVTTGYHAAPARNARAALLSARLGVPLLPRIALAPLFAQTGARHLYVVGTHRDEILSADGGACFVQPGLFAMKLMEGERHPIVRAVRGTSPRVESVLDLTMGLGNDALHLAGALQCRVHGVEHSPVLFALLEEGVPRLAASKRAPVRAAAALLSVEHGAALDVLRSKPTGSVDVVFLDPMMSHPKRSTPSFEVLRAFAHDAAATDELLAEAGRVARLRVVWKRGRGALPVPADCPLAFSRRERGAETVYDVAELAPS